ncbi:late embryogenesis abundant protein D-34-like protein [Tanacetum coccineum]
MHIPADYVPLLSHDRNLSSPDASSMENHGKQPSYGTSLHARPLLETPTSLSNLNKRQYASLANVCFGEALEGTPRTAGSKAVDKSGAAAIQVAEVRATGSTLLITGGLVAQSQSDATLNRYEKCLGSCNPSFSQLRPVDAIEGEKDEAIASTN